MSKRNSKLYMLKDFRNFIVHEYFGVGPRVVWDLMKLELDELIRSYLWVRF